MPATTNAKRKNPAGGLTAGGRRYFHEKQGSHFRPGVKRVRTVEDMKRKGSFLRRHYGKRTIDPLTDRHGEPGASRYLKRPSARVAKA